MIPTVETPRLILRAPHPGDFDAAFAIRNEEAVTRFIAGQKATPEEIWGRILRYIGHWQVLGFGFWSIVERASGAVVGEAGFADFHREMTPAFGDTPEMGWILSGAVHGKGYATEAVAAALAWADVHIAHDRTACMINPENVPSLRVAAKVGFRETGAADYRGEPVVLFARQRATSST
jgi:RimJ/RimL family protein N-acetyltransferase